MPRNLKSRARSLRRNSTEAERLLWQHLRNRQIADCKFRRQVVVEDYIVDFLCPKAKLIIEIDGSQHLEQREYDSTRTQKLESRGYKVLRFWNNEVLNDTEAVLEVISQNLTPSPRPSPKGRGGPGF